MLDYYAKQYSLDCLIFSLSHSTAFQTNPWILIFINIFFSNAWRKSSLAWIQLKSQFVSICLNSVTVSVFFLIHETLFWHYDNFFAVMEIQSAWKMSAFSALERWKKKNYLIFHTENTRTAIAIYDTVSVNHSNVVLSWTMYQHSLPKMKNLVLPFNVKWSQIWHARFTSFYQMIMSLSLQYYLPF